MDSELVQHLIDIKAELAALHTKVDAIDNAVGGNGQPGLEQRMQTIEADRNKLWGAGVVLGALNGLIEYFIHRHT